MGRGERALAMRRWRSGAEQKEKARSDKAGVSSSCEFHPLPAAKTARHAPRRALSRSRPRMLARRSRAGRGREKGC
eukprot:620363-Rhodomonas_salina.1